GSMSDRTWNRLGRRRPYFLVGAILTALALFFMPYSSFVLMAVLFLWLLDASVNISMEPFRAFVADKLVPEQRTTGFVMQSFFIGAGAAIASALPLMFRKLGVEDSTASGVPLTVKYSFQVGAFALLFAVLWTVFTSKEYPPEDLAEFERRRRETRGVGNWFREMYETITHMPATMKQLAVVQLFTWLGLFCMWMYFGLTTAQQVFGVTDLDDPAQRVLKDQGNEWGGFGFSVYSIVCFAVAFLLPLVAKATSRKTVHALALACGGVGLLSVYLIHDKWVLMLTMVGVGVAWASILSMPYAILSTALPPARMGVYMGVFNFFIVIPEITAALTFQPLVKYVFNNNPLYVVMLGGVCLLVAAALTLLLVRETDEPVPVGAVLRGDEHEPLTTQGTAQPVPSTGLLDDERRG
ncbi:MAG TPA: MFS transporter, partial [Pyrinomonadaceae bacterium]|nr:MFS transporter [Pyrinomonadaceae bacterium]